MNPLGTKLSSPFLALSAPKVGVVIPTLNEEAHIELTIRLLLADGWTKDAITIVDGGSTDQTISYAQNYGITVIKCERGRARQMQMGADHSVHDAILFLHADSQLQKGSRNSLMAALRNGAHAGCFKRRFTPNHWIFHITSLAANLRAQLLGITYGDQALWIRKDVLSQIGGIPQLDCFEDVELGLRARKIQSLTLLDPFILTSARRFKSGKLKTLWKDAMLTWSYVIRRIMSQR